MNTLTAGLKLLHERGFRRIVVPTLPVLLDNALWRETGFYMDVLLMADHGPWTVLRVIANTDWQPERVFDGVHEEWRHELSPDRALEFILQNTSLSEEDSHSEAEPEAHGRGAQTAAHVGWPTDADAKQYFQSLATG